MRKRKKFKKLSFLYRGSNERQFGCQNLNLPFVTFCRSRFGDYKEYHTSDDNLNLINGNSLFDSLKCVLEIVNEIQNNNIYIKKTICEPFLTKYNLIKTIGFGKFKKEEKNIRNINRLDVSYAINDDLKCDSFILFHICGADTRLNIPTA